MSFEEFLNQLIDEFNGCGWLNEESPEYRERGDWDDVVGQNIVIEDMRRIKDYHAVILRNDPHVYLSSGALKTILDKYADEYGKYLRNIVFRIGEKRGFQNRETGERQEYRPCMVVGRVSGEKHAPNVSRNKNVKEE